MIKVDASRIDRVSDRKSWRRRVTRPRPADVRGVSHQMPEVDPKQAHI